MDDIAIMATLTDLIIAGTDTTSAMLSWFVAYQCKYPEEQEKLHKEYLNHEIPPTKLDSESTPYLDAFIKETFRLRPAAPLSLPHVTDQEVEVAGYTIPKDTMIFPNLWGAMRDPTIWKDGEEFRYIIN